MVALGPRLQQVLLTPGAAGLPPVLMGLAVLS